MKACVAQTGEIAFHISAGRFEGAIVGVTAALVDVGAEEAVALKSRIGRVVALACEAEGRALGPDEIGARSSWVARMATISALVDVRACASVASIAIRARASVAPCGVGTARGAEAVVSSVGALVDVAACAASAVIAGAARALRVEEVREVRGAGQAVVARRAVARSARRVARSTRCSALQISLCWTRSVAAPVVKQRRMGRTRRAILRGWAKAGIATLVARLTCAEKAVWVAASAAARGTRAAQEEPLSLA